jgi:hypothetical protein
MMTQAAEVLQRIINRENFDSEYTVAANSETYSVMRVDPLKIFYELTQVEKINFAEEMPKGWLSLNIWNIVWYWIPDFSKWLCVSTDNVYNASLGWHPDFVVTTFEEEEYIIDVENLRIFKEVK